MHTRTIVDFFMRKKQMKLQWKSSPCPKRQSWINHYDTTEMLNRLAQCSNSEHDKRGFWGAWSWETSGSFGSSGSIRAWSDRGSPIHYLVLTLCVSVDMRHWHIGAATVSRGLVALGGDGGVGGWWSAWAWKLHGRDSLWQHRLACEDSRPGGQGCSLWSLFAPPSVLHFRALLSARHWIHLEWLRSLSTF